MVETDAFFSALVRDTILKAIADGRLIAHGTVEAIIALLFALGDGIMWRATIRPELDNRAIITQIFKLLRDKLLSSTVDTNVS